jgi:hypothetical protein
MPPFAGCPSRMLTHYEVLGVSPHASAGEIRAAYLALIKRHHPDLRSGREDAEQGLSRDINLAFSVLRDPQKRARYDAELNLRRRGVAQAGHRGRRPAPIVRASPYRYPEAPAGRRSWAAPTLAFIGILAMTVALTYIVPTPESTPVEAEAVHPARSGRRNPPQPDIHDPYIADAVGDLTLISIGGRPEDALSYSRRCYDELRSFAHVSMLDWCIAFDLAAAQWLSHGRGGAVAAFFSPQAMESRQTEAMEALSIRHEEAEDRVTRIGQRVISHLANHAGAPRSR